MTKAIEVCSGIWMVGSSSLSEEKDCCVYLIEFPGELVLFDSGAGDGFNEILLNIKSTGVDPEELSKLILSHCHIDHSGGAERWMKEFGIESIAHQRCAEILARADPLLTASLWYNMTLLPFQVSRSFYEDNLTLEFGNETLELIYTPGHSPDSISAYLEREGDVVLFGQDIHGPLHPSLGSNLENYLASMRKLLTLKATILCEGHYGIIRGRDEVEDYISGYIEHYSSSLA